METSANIECPYCGSSIKNTVSVCVHCKREVATIISLQNKLNQFLAAKDETNINNLNPADNTLRDNKKIHFGFFMAGFMAFSAILLTFLIRIDNNLMILPLYQIFFIPVLSIFLFIAVTYVKDFNIWIFIILIFFLPKAVFHFTEFLNFTLSKRLLNSFNQGQLIFVFFSGFIALVFTIIFNRVDFDKVFGFRSAQNYLSKTSSTVDKFEKLVLLVTGLIASIKSII